MTQYFPFRPSATSVFSFSPVLDGETYSATVPWLLFGARYYLSLQKLDGTQVWYGAVVGSPTGVQIQSLSWAHGRATAATAVPHGFKPASTVSLAVRGCSPDAFNGAVAALVTGPSSVSWPLATDPGAAMVFGSASRDVNILGGVANGLGGYFSSTMMFRTASQTFEVNP